MLKDKQSEEYSSNLVRQSKIDRKKNRVFILQYSPGRTLSKKKFQWQNDDTDQQKQANYLIKKQSLKDQVQNVSPSNGDINHRSIINRLIDLISKGKNISKSNDSGCEKIVRALVKLNDTNGALSNMKWAIQNLKKYTMTCSSNKYELFIQSKHLTIKDTPKWPESHTQKQNSQKQKVLQKIAEYSEQFFVKNENSNVSIANEINSERLKRQNTKRASSSFNSFEKQTLQKNLRESVGNLTTKEELFSLQNLKFADKDTRIQVSSIKNLRLSFPLACSYPKFKLEQAYEKICQKQQLSASLRQIVKGQKNTQVLKIEQGAESLNELKSQFQKIYIANQPSKGKYKQPNSPIFSLMYALPTDLDEQKTKVETKMQKIGSVRSSKNEAGKKVSKADSHKKRQEVFNPSQYAQRILFGMPQTAEQKISKEYRNFLQDKSRKRISSLPKITFTYVSRQNYNVDSLKVQKASQINQKNNNFLTKNSISKKSSKEQLHSTFQPKNAELQQRQKVQVVNQPNVQFEKSIKNSSSRQNLLVIQNPVGSSKVIQNEYYGEPYPMSRQIPQNLEAKRERILTAQPGWQKQVQFVGIQQKLPVCCWQQKLVRSQSLNQRILVRNNSQNNIVIG